MLSHDQQYIIPSGKPRPLLISYTLAVHVGVKAMYFNLSGIFFNHTITSAEMSSNSIITGAVVSQKFKVVTFCMIDLLFT